MPDSILVVCEMSVTCNDKTVMVEKPLNANMKTWQVAASWVYHTEGGGWGDTDREADNCPQWPT